MAAISPSNSIPHPSLSRPVPTEAPRLVHSFNQQKNSVLSLSADANHIYSGSQSQDICVWDRNTCTLKTTLKGHTGSVLALEYAEDMDWLFSASGDSTVRVWSTKTHKPLFVLHPYLETDAGDIFCLVWSRTFQTIYFGCQNTSLQWYHFDAQHNILEQHQPSSGTSTPSSRARKAHKFFDSYPQYERRPADIFAMNGSLTPSTTFSSDGESCVQLPAPVPLPRAVLHIPPENVVDSAHYGYVYCMALLPSNREGSDDPDLSNHGKTLLATGSGDESLWNCAAQGLTLLHTFECCHGAVLSLTVRGDTIFAGCQDGYVKIWDLETKTLVRTIIVQEGVDVLSLSMLYSDLYTCSANGQVQRWSASFDCSASWSAHDGIVLSSIMMRCAQPNHFRLVTGGNDDHIKVWEVEPPTSRASHKIDGLPAGDSESIDDIMVYALSKFVSIPSISNSPAHQEDCRQAAIWLKKCFNQLGADASLLPVAEGKNPLVLATYRGAQLEKPKPRILFYGHYDVISAYPEGWTSDPFVLSGRNGYLYGRGVTDNKGPVIAAASAAAELLSKRALGVDLIFLVEGEEEAGSRGFAETVRRNKDLIGHVDAILVSNSTWITEDPPCITYGLRGVVRCSIEISSKRPDVHSGVEGGAVVEPMFDMVKLLATLMDDQRRVLIDGFYKDVRPMTEDEQQLYRLLSVVTQRPASSLSSRWREPSLTIHGVEVSGPKNPTVIPAQVKAQVSIRIVPDQDLDTIAGSLCRHLQTSFLRLNSPNELKVAIDHKADWWLGSLEDPYFQALEIAIRDEWGVDPLRIREGGSIPSIPYLEKEFGCHALHLPMGQSSDQAHLANERISLTNLRKGKSVIERFLGSVAGNKESGTDNC
ncbi:glutathione degradosome [Gloeophyllum trabeum ATCC 11539]|uniref:Glutathione degradosome n=1 Tax=Gloeophyllum trabeum (strain ATCC 11539 / FP-39264 / Madison 617) TaxID=670483 RepID=S7Q3W1_GLOTA|nr:glutathione degradosome [Gloeophyllum trabeum ATCC 11539]EPQ54686.1 glutathione degradosome [Gloeophyllum trabeum ATCC 11539]